MTNRRIVTRSNSSTPNNMTSPITPGARSEEEFVERRDRSEHMPSVEDLERTVHIPTNNVTVPIPTNNVTDVLNPPPKEDDWLCAACKKDLRSEKESIGCDFKECNKWFHPSCLSGKTVFDQDFWQCHLCSISKDSVPLRVDEEIPAISPKVKLGELKGTQFVETIDSIYEQIVAWQRNTFRLPTGKAGKSFLKEMTTIFDYFNSGSPLQPYAMKLVMIYAPLMLQKPSKNSKTKDHTICLNRRLLLWQSGDLMGLLREGKAIQKRLTNSKNRRTNDNMKIFTRLMLQGKVSAALKWINSAKHGLLNVTPDVHEQLLKKHPEASGLEEGSVYHGPHHIPPEVTFHPIDSHAIYTAAKNTHGSSGPSGIDADSWQRFLCSKSFGKESDKLCTAIADFTRKIASTKQNPKHLSAYTASRLIPLDKGDNKHSVRPIGVGEVLRRIVGKSIVHLLKQDIAQSTAPIQSCGGVKGGVEAAVHGLRAIWEDSETEGVILVDASNAFNCLNRRAGLQNTGILCPEIVTYLENTYLLPSDLYITGGKGQKIKSNEGTTQGDTTAMAFYAVSLMKMIRDAKEKVDGVKEVFYADDGAGGGKLDDIQIFWNFLISEGPKYGYVVNPSKTVLIVKPQYVAKAKSLFSDIKVDTEGQRYLGSYIGTDEGKEKFVKEEVKTWIKDIEGLCAAAETEPHLAYSAYVYGTSKKWNYLMRTTPNISHLLDSIEDTISSHFIPAITGRNIDNIYRTVFSLPVRHGGLAIENPSAIAEREYKNSLSMTKTLWSAIVNQETDVNIDEINDSEVIQFIKKMKETSYEKTKFDILSYLPERQIRFIMLACEKGASSWLSSLPLEQYGFALNKEEFMDAIALRYNFGIPGRSMTCICGEMNTPDHSLICKRGGFLFIRHDTIRDTTARLLEKVAHGVETEPRLQPVGTRTLPPGANLKDGARSDIVARGFWSPLDKSYFDVRVLHPGALSNEKKTLKKMYSDQEDEKKRQYNSRIMEVEHGRFTPLVFSTTGGVGRECSFFMKKLGEKLSAKTNQTYPDTINFIRRRLRIELLRTCLIAIRGHRGRFYERDLQIDELDLNLIPDKNKIGI